MTRKEIIEWIGERLESERLQLSRIHDKNSAGAGMCIGAIDTLEDLLKWLTEGDE